MSTISDFNGLHPSLKASSIFTAVCSAFIFVDLFFMAPFLFGSVPFYIPIVVSIVLAFCWYIVCFASLSIWMGWYSKYFGNSGSTLQYYWYIISIVYISTISVTCLFFKCRLRLFFILLVTFSTLRIIIGVILIMIKAVRKKNNL